VIWLKKGNAMVRAPANSEMEAAGAAGQRKRVADESREIATAGDSFGGHGLNDSLAVRRINFVAQSDDVHEPADRFVAITNERSNQRGLRLKPFVVGERDSPRDAARIESIRRICANPRASVQLR